MPDGILPFHYRAAGFRIDSEFEFAQATPLEPAAGWEADVTFKKGSVASSPGQLTSGDERYGCAVSDDSLVLVAAQQGGGKMLSVGLNGIAYFRGYLPLHAGAILTSSSCVAFCGDKGAGKSTLTCALALRGYGMITDDLLVVREEAGVLVAWPVVERAQIIHDRLAQFDGKATWSSGIGGDGKIVASIGEVAPYAPYAMAAIYHLAWGDFNVRQLSQLEAAAEMNKFLRKPEWCDQSGNALIMKRHWLNLAARIPIVRITRPRNVVLADIVDLVLDDLTKRKAAEQRRDDNAR